MIIRIWTAAKIFHAGLRDEGPFIKMNLAFGVP